MHGSSIRLLALVAASGYLSSANGATVYGLGLVGNNAEGKQITANAKMDSKTGNLTWSETYYVDPTFYGCNVAFGADIAEFGAKDVFFVPSGSNMDKPPQIFGLQVIEAETGAVLHSANLSQKYDLPVIAYDAADGLIYGIGNVVNKPNGGTNAVSINATTGEVTELYKNVDIPTLVLCNSAWGPGREVTPVRQAITDAVAGGAAAPGTDAQANVATAATGSAPSYGTFYFVSSLNNGSSLDLNDVLAFDVSTGQFSSDWATQVVPSSFVAWTPPGATRQHVLVLGFPCDTHGNCGATSLIDVDPFNWQDNVTLVTLPAEYNPQQGVMAYSADCGGDSPPTTLTASAGSSLESSASAQGSQQAPSAQAGCAYAVMNYRPATGDQVDKLVTFNLTSAAEIMAARRRASLEPEQRNKADRGRVMASATAIGPAQLQPLHQQTDEPLDADESVLEANAISWHAVTVNDTYAFFGLHGLGVA